MFVGVSTALTAVRRVFHPFIKEGLKLYYRFINTQPDFLLDGSTSFSGSSQYIDCGTGLGNALGDNYTGSFTVSMWLKINETSGDVGPFEVSNFTGDGSWQGIFGFRIKYNVLSWITFWSRRIEVAFSDTSSWHHIVGVYDSRGADFTKLYVDGVSVGSATGGSFPSTSNIDLNGQKTIIGAYYSASNSINGKIANVGIWSRALSASEVESIQWRGSYSELKGTELTNLISWYNLNSTGLGAEVISNGTMETVSTNTLLPNYESFPEDWTSSAGSPSIHERSSTQAFAGTYSLRYGSSGNTFNGVNQGHTVTGGVAYRLEFYIYGVTGTTMKFSHFDGSANPSTLENGDALSYYAQSVTIGEWKKFTYDLTTYGSGTITGYSLLIGSDVAGTEFYIDNVSLKRIGVSTPDSQGSNDGTIEGATVNTDSYSGESPFKPRIQDKATPKMAVQLADGSTSFDGTDDYIDLPMAFSNTNHTISGWFKLDNVSGNRTLFCGRDGNDDGIRVLLNTSQVLYQINVSDEASGTGSISANEWTHVACTYDGTTQSIYLNGSLSASQSISRTVSTTQTAKIGRTAYGTSDYMLGSLANIALYSSALTQTQIQELMFTEKYSGLSADLKTNLVSWYDLGSEDVTASQTELIDDVSNRTFETGDGNSDWVNVTCDVFDDTNDLSIETSGSQYCKLNATYINGGNGFELNKRYRLTFDASGVSGLPRWGTAPTRTYAYISNGTNQTLEFTCLDADSGLFLSTNSGGNVNIDNISVVQVKVSDSHGSNTGEVSDATINTGYTYSPHGVVDPLNFGEVYSGRALDFDGNVDYIELGTSSSLDINAFTISTWVKFDSVTEGTIFGEYLDGNNYSTVRIISGKVYSYGFTGGDVWEANTSGTITTGQWYHIAITIGTDTSTPIIYIDGVAVGLENVNGSAIGTAKRIGHDASNIGRWFPTIPRYLDGKISSFKIFNTNITQAQVQELYTNPEQILPTGVSASNLKLDLPMQEGSGSYIYDGSGNQNHGTITGATWVSGEEYGYQASLVRSNTPMIFDGSNDVVTIADNATTQDIFDTGGTVQLIYKLDGTSASQLLFSKSANSIYVNMSGSNNIGFRTEHATTNGKWTAPFTNNTEFVHLVITHDKSSVSNNPSIYVNGSALTVTEILTPVGASVSDSGSNLLIGSAPFAGIANEVAMWDKVLDADAVSALYNSGVPLDLTSDSGNYDNSDSLVFYQRNDGNTIWTDRANTGVASFDGVDDKISLGTGTFNIGKDGYSYSISSWFKAPDQGSNDGIFSNHTSSNEFQMLLLANGRLHTHVYDGSSQGTVQTSTNDEYNDSQWHHVVSILDSSADTLSLYVDGSLIGSTTWNMYTTGSLVAHIGSRSASTNFFEGQIAGTHIFNVALTANEITELYNIDKRSSISGHSQFSNCVASYLMGAGTGDTASTIQDQTSNNNDGTVNGASIIGYNDGTASGSPVEILIPEGSTEGRDNQGYYLSDTTLISNGIRLHGSEYIEVQDSEVLSFGDGTDDRPFSVEAWVKMEDATDFKIINKGIFNSTGEWWLEVDSADKFGLYLLDESVASTYELALYNTALTSYEGQWIHIGATYDGRGGSSANAGIKLYLNGSSVTTTLSGGGTYVAMENLGADVHIGKYDSQYAKGLIDEVRIYSKELSASEVLKNYNSGKSSHQ